MAATPPPSYEEATGQIREPIIRTLPREQNIPVDRFIRYKFQEFQTELSNLFNPSSSSSRSSTPVQRATSSSTAVRTPPQTPQQNITPKPKKLKRRKWNRSSSSPGFFKTQWIKIKQKFPSLQEADVETIGTFIIYGVMVTLMVVTFAALIVLIAI